MGFLRYYLELRKRLLQLWVGFIKDVMRSAHPDKPDKELGIDQPFFQERILDVYLDKFKKK